MGILSGLQPEPVFSHFEAISAIPRPSGQERQISDYLAAFARAHDLAYRQDERGNVILWKDAAPGYEDCPPVILQGHMDMVCEQEPGRGMDFTTQGLDLEVSDGWVSARGTTLGGDDGIALAYCLALLEAEDIPHPPLEVLITTSEETGMGGARAADLSGLRGRRLINLDSEEEGQIITSCAGGCRVDCRVPLEYQTQTGQLCSLTAGGLTGGHSGTEIGKGGANACRLLSRVLMELGQQFSFSVVSLCGGGRDNVIPQQASARILLSERLLPACCAALERCRRELGKEYQATDPGLTLTLTLEGEGTFPVLTVDSAQKALLLVQYLPNGVQAMSQTMPGMVETSLNLGYMETGREALALRFSLRSASRQALAGLKRQLAEALTAVGGTASFSGEYPPWEYRASSPLREQVARAYRELYGREPELVAIHAGLECGLLAEKLPGVDAVSIGPNMRDIHTPRERLEIASVRRTWDWLLRVLAERETGTTAVS